MKKDASTEKSQVDQTLLKDRHPELFTFFKEYNPEMFIYCLDAKGKLNNFGRLALEHVKLKKKFDEGEKVSMGHGSSAVIIGSPIDRACAVARFNSGSSGLDD